LPERILGIMVSKTYHAYLIEIDEGTYEITEIEERCTDLGAAYGAATNLRTVKVYYEKGTDKANSGAIKLVRYPDGRQDSFSYEYGTWQSTGPGQGTFAVGSGEYKRETVVHGTVSSPDGIAYKTTKEMTINDDIGNTLLTETWINTGDGYERIQWTAFEYDELGREVKVTNSDGTWSESAWDCCGKTSSTDFQGQTTTFNYDDLHRVSTETRMGSAGGDYPTQSDIITSYTYDAEGRTLTTTRSAGSLSQGTQQLYQVDGRMSQSVDQAGLITQYDYSTDGLVTTVTRPGGATEISTRYPDGRTASFTGTGVMPRYYAYGVDPDGHQWTTEYQGFENSLRWVKTTGDSLGRTLRVERPGFSGVEVTAQHYNNLGQLSGTSVSGQADTIYEYDQLGQQVRSGLDVNSSGALVLNSEDRISETDTSYVSDNGVWWQRTR